MGNNGLITNNAIYQIEEICAFDVGRNFTPLALKHTNGNLKKIADSIIATKNPHIVIITGFFISSAQMPETDGPVGAAQLAFAFTELGFCVRMVSDSLCMFALKAACEIVAQKELLSFDEIPLQDSISVMENYIYFYRMNFVTHVIAIERVGSAKDSKCYNMRGIDISPFSPRLEKLLIPEVVTIGIGDGGNEIGMGNLPDAALTNVAHAEKIQCQIKCDYLLPCGISNWGAWAILLALAMYEPWRSVILKRTTWENYERILQNICIVGAVDGTNPSLSMSVDGLSLEQNKEIWQQMIRLIQHE